MSPEQVEIFRKMSPAKKLELAANFWFGARELKAAGLRSMHPDWSEEQIQQKVYELFLYARH
jgi:hypothetical protein